MIVEIRTYTIRPGKMPAYLKLVESIGLPLQRQHLQKLIGLFVSEVGPLNEVTQVWGFDDEETRRTCRASLLQDGEFRMFMDEAMPMVTQQKSSLVRPAAFAPIG
ncbi:MAG: hypothetical protein BGO03_11865 [Mesorhizobium sp. 61-13]|jgi:hypothetical protein|nr:NIPSNAP family protein [Mesorhizobium sp.]OJU52349.1 MAG: hypothetical protein BGO03_11865 [Mesorhizobium sp. 61-13]